MLPPQPHGDEVVWRWRRSEDGVPIAERGKGGGATADVVVADEERQGEGLGHDSHALLVCEL